MPSYNSMLTPTGQNNIAVEKPHMANLKITWDGTDHDQPFTNGETLPPSSQASEYSACGVKYHF